MATALLTAWEEPDLIAGQRSLFAATGGEPTLDEVIVGVWEGLAARRPVECPVCDGAMRPVRRSAGSRGVAVGRCDSCGTAIR